MFILVMMITVFNGQGYPTGTSATTQEFEAKAACLNALTFASKLEDDYIRVSGVCVPK